ncbi:acyltransferase [Streptomyces sp. LX-29]|uniref:acyltransferase family protein n=1 Tax=Streptomyces sp. LX-29 TaxID=2900152 RepID=UPI00240E2248|nr:acyltransferase [Streptomyces sp. LX-29]WFB11211.1 acyltransferase [Streptomyces sp. LX-29]
MTAAWSEPPRPERRPELDAIRVLVVVGLVFFHSALVFDTRDDFYVKNSETTDATMVLAGLGVVWAMPMLFLIAGFGSWHSLRRRGPAGFVVERLRRLGVPLVFATLTIIPVPQWLRLRAADPGYHESYLDFLPDFYDVRPDPADAPFLLEGAYFETGHLWFVVLLLAFSLAVVPLAHWLAHGRRRRIVEWLATAAQRRGSTLPPAAPLAVISAFVGLEEAYAGWSRWAYLLFFGYGLVLAADERFRAAMRHDARAAAVLGAALFLGGLPGFLSADDPFTDMTGTAIGARALYGAAGWCLLVAILGSLDRRRLARARERAAGSAVTQPAGRGRRLYGYLSAAVLPLYVLHQPIVVAVAYGVVGWDAPIAVEYTVIVASSSALTLAAYDLLVRRTRVTRFLFGMREPGPRLYPRKAASPHGRQGKT